MSGGAGRPVDRANNLDHLRLVFAAAVMLSHAFEYVDGDRGREPLTLVFHTISFAEAAVDGFFVLSGFLITQSWRRSPDLASFLRRRAARLYPAFVVASLFAVLVVGRIAATDPATYYAALDPRRIAADMLALAPPHTPPIFAGLPYPWADGPMWTIQFEFLFYLAVAALGVAGVLRRPRFVAGLWLAAMATYLFASVRNGPLAGPDAGAGLGSLIRLATMFASGMLFAVFDGWTEAPRWTAGAALAGLAIGLCSPLLAEPALATLGAYLMLSIGLRRRAAGRSRLPDISYGAYLYGGPVEMLLIFRFHLPSLAIFAVALPAAGLLGWASWRWIEAPALRRYAAGVRRPALASC